MSDPNLTRTSEERDDFLLRQARLHRRAEAGAYWYYWIAGISLLNTACFHFGAKMSFAIGLGLTQALDLLALQLRGNLPQPALLTAAVLLLDLAAAAVFVLLGHLASRLRLWAYVAGMILYAGDGLLFLAAGEYLGLLFHVLVLIFVAIGLVACQRWRRLDAQALSPAA